MSLAVATVLALLIGLSLGAVGGGGSILAVPVLIGVAGLTVEQATTGSLVVVGVSSLVGMVSHHLAGRVRIGPGLAFGAAGIGGALVGTKIHDALDADVLLVGFALVMLVVAGRMVQNLRRPSAARAAGDLPLVLPDPEPVERDTATATWRDGATVRRYVSTTATGPSVATRTAPPATPERTGVSARQVALVLATGTGVGLLTGIFGVGGGFVIVPALMLVLGFPIAEATGTSLLVIAVNSAVALTLRGGVGDVDWSVILPFTGAAVVGVLAGRRVADRVPARTLTAALTALIVVVALWTAAKGISGLV
jgi:uncharacterized membrane protein YfcA